VADGLLGKISIDKSSFDKQSPFSKKEQSYPVKVRASQYEEIRRIAFENHEKMTDVISRMIDHELTLESKRNKNK
jgi:hypothetical protein